MSNDQIRPDVEQWLAEQFGGGFSVCPITNCPHVAACLQSDLSFYEQKGVSVFGKGQAEGCPVADENWLCLKSGKVLCSRYKNEHMLFNVMENDNHSV